jgi:predicted GIY-YIG superfamily endonuclease
LGLYIGYSTDLRLSLDGTQGASQATSCRGPWNLIYYEAYVEEADAIGRERYFEKWRRQKAAMNFMRNLSVGNSRPSVSE